MVKAVLRQTGLDIARLYAGHFGGDDIVLLALDDVDRGAESAVAVLKSKYRHQAIDRMGAVPADCRNYCKARCVHVADHRS
jgi:hypothetical protein